MVFMISNATMKVLPLNKLFSYYTVLQMYMLLSAGCESFTANVLGRSLPQKSCLSKFTPIQHNNTAHGHFISISVWSITCTSILYVCFGAVPTVMTIYLNQA